MERDPDTGRRVKRMVQEYEYEPEMEQTYRYGHVCMCIIKDVQHVMYVQYYDGLVLR